MQLKVFVLIFILVNCVFFGTSTQQSREKRFLRGLRTSRETGLTEATEHVSSVMPTGARKGFWKFAALILGSPFVVA